MGSSLSGADVLGWLSVPVMTLIPPLCVECHRVQGPFRDLVIAKADGEEGCNKVKQENNRKRKDKAMGRRQRKVS